MKLVKKKGNCSLAALVILTAVLLSVPFILIPQASAQTNPNTDNWPIYRHDAAHTGYSETSAPASAPLLWSSTIDATPASTPAPPSVVNGYVYVGSGDNNIYCFDAATGTKVWTYPTGNYVSCTPAVVDGRVYAGSADGNIYCLEASSGTMLWSFSTVLPGQSGGSGVSSPTVVGDRVYFGPLNDYVYCLNAVDGGMVWNFSTGSDTISGFASPAVDGGYVYVGDNSDGNVFCLNAADGSKVWNYTADGAVRSPTVANGNVYVGSKDGNAYCLRASDGAKIWNYTTEYNSAGPSHGYHWGNTVSDPAIAYGNVYVGSSNFLLYCLDAASGSHIWDFTADAQFYAASTVADGYVLAGSYDGYLYCLNASDGSEVWSYPAGEFSPVSAGGSAGSAAVAGGVVYVVGNGVLYALGTPTSTTSPPSYENVVIFAVVFIVAVVLLAAALLRWKRKV
ncbi:MAG: PQQ-binding-like beta-propeller repeat protein [Candidatus Bathyarchaeota archaeon]|nr:PQQ-binding-like beta-propeller repeat protein [Candidatus Bathyarchaeota archaeon]